ncbi:MAG TPA: ribbon-helix-helix protein, CopG family [Myxococcota bacterium]|nr:ribbon-helix-helix protein, CopG family [Myxococcota bacterium]
MIRTQVQLEPEQYEKLRKLAHRHKISISETVRRLIKKGMRSGVEEDELPDAGKLLKLSGIASSGRDDIGRRHDDYLDEDFGQ